MASGKCLNWGTAYGKSAKFCKDCGEKVPSDGTAEPSTPHLTEATLDACEEELNETAAHSDSSSDGAGGPELFDLADEEAPAVSPASSPATSHVVKVLNGLAAGRIARLSDGAAIVIGSGRDADVALTDECMSRRHATLRVVDGKLLVNDEGSTNGTFIRVGSDPRELLDGDCIFLGNTLLQIGKE
jgi:hypothetical protein